MEDPFRDYFTGVEDATSLIDLEVSRKDSGEASGLFIEVQRALNWASTLHREACSRSRAELSRYEADLQRLTEKRNAIRLHCEQREEEIKDLRADLTKSHQDQTDLTKQLREEVDIIKEETLGWKEGIDRLAVEKEIVRAQFSSAESQLQGMKERSSVQARTIEDLEAWLTSELAKAKSEAEKAKAEVEAFVVVYRADAEAAQEIHARGFDLTEEIKKAKELEAESGALAFDDDDKSKSGSESGEELDGEEVSPGDNQEP
ncbi:uncharacterized protein [Nicotiana tomentosiformis]|uniref:uncharacterized protein n=1 Tax=Nicotiana tomentosiformis TaxID=4098 RepID=UPI00388C447D